MCAFQGREQFGIYFRRIRSGLKLVSHAARIDDRLLKLFFGLKDVERSILGWFNDINMGDKVFFFCCLVSVSA